LRNSTKSYLRLEIEVRGQIPAQAVLSPEKNPVNHCSEAGWTLQPVRSCVNLRRSLPTAIRAQRRPARSLVARLPVHSWPSLR
jgi:hypothetical protein